MFSIPPNSALAILETSRFLPRLHAYLQNIPAPQTSIPASAPLNYNNIDPALLDEPKAPMSDSEDATNARRNELFEESQSHANVPAPDNANIPAPDNANIILAPGTANIILALDNANIHFPEPSSSENDTHDSNLDVPSSPSELSEGEFANWYYKGPSGRGWAREKTPWRPRREKPSAKNAAGGTAAGQGDTGSNGAGPSSQGPSGQAAPAPANGDAAQADPPAAPEHHHPNPQTGGDNAVQQPDRPTQEELPADPLTRTTGPGDYDWGPAPAFALDEPEMDAQTQAELFALFNNGAFERPAVPEEEPLAGSSASAAANTVSPPSFPEVVAAAQDQQQEPDEGTDEDAEYDEFDYLFEEEESSTAADASTVAGTPANDFQTPGTEYSDADSNFK